MRLQVVSEELPYCSSSDYQVIIHLHRRTPPPRPRGTRLTDAHWDFINDCWGERGEPSSRPNAQDVLEAISAF